MFTLAVWFCLPLPESYYAVIRENSLHCGKLWLYSHYDGSSPKPCVKEKETILLIDFLLFRPNIKVNPDVCRWLTAGIFNSPLAQKWHFRIVCWLDSIVCPVKALPAGQSVWFRIMSGQGLYPPDEHHSGNCHCVDYAKDFQPRGESAVQTLKWCPVSDCRFVQDTDVVMYPAANGEGILMMWFINN